MKKFKASPGEVVYRDECLFAIIREESPINRERLVKRMSEEMGITQASIAEELRRFQGEGASEFSVMMADVLKEQERMDVALNDFERWAWSRGKLLGLDFGWPTLTEKMEGLQTGVYLVGGRANVGVKHLRKS